MNLSLNPSRRFLFTLCFTTALAACGAAGSGGAAAGGDGSSDGTDPVEMPALYVEQTRWLINRGKVVDQETYRQHLAICMENGAAQTVPLKPADVERLGHVHTQSWRRGGQYAIREESWGWTVGTQGCHFRLLHKQTESLGDGKRYDYTLDLADRSGERADNGEPPEIQPTLEPTEANIASVTDSTFKVRQTVAGQPCLSWQDADGYRACLWTGGEKWGFGSLGPARGDDADGSYPGQIALSADPADGDSGWHVTTARMTVGQALDPHVFDLPHDLKLHDAGGSGD